MKPASAEFPISMPSLSAWRDYDSYLTSEAWIGRDALYLTEIALAQTYAGHEQLSGYCRLCVRHAGFLYRPPGPGQAANWREELKCAFCGLITRHRLGLDIVQQLVARRDEQPRLFVTEQASPLFVWVARRWPQSIGSEFIANDEVRARLEMYLADISKGELREILHQDCTALTLPDADRDVVLSFDVLEHIPDFEKALREFARVLKPGGWLVLTVPFDVRDAVTRVRARRRDDGSIEHLLEPEYHGDPTDDGLCLAFHNFGWDLLASIRAAGFEDAWLISAWSPPWGWLGPADVIVARR